MFWLNTACGHLPERDLTERYMKKQKIKKIMVIFVCILVNLVGKMVTNSLELPVWLDMTGICLGVYYTGFFGGLTVAGVTGSLYAIADLSAFAYIAAGILVAVFVHFMMHRDCFSCLLNAALYGFGLGLLCMVVAFPMNYLKFQGYTGNLWGNALVDMLRWYGVHRYLASAAGTAIVELVDKQCVMILSALVIWLIKKGKAFRMSKKKMTAAQKLTAWFLIAAALASGVILPEAAHGSAQALEETEYLETIYNNTNGLVSSEANTIEETPDGTIWIGGYAGLTRFDGADFQFIRQSGLTSVNHMFTDHKGRLWIGTNDSGIAVFDQGEYTYYTIEDGLPSNSIRCFAEDQDGTVYIGTTDRICFIDSTEQVQYLETDRDLVFVKKMKLDQGTLIVLDNNGKLSAIREGKVLSLSGTADEGLYYNTIARTRLGLLAGTTTGELFVLEVQEDDFRIKEKLESGLNDVETIYESKDGRIWLASDQGIGYFDTAMEYHELLFEGSDAAFECIHEDYQGNIWLASTRYGVIKLSKSYFQNLFGASGISAATVNAVLEYDGDYYCGTDQGLVVLDADTYHSKSNKLTTALRGKRIRGMLADAQGNLWFCTYAQEGLICCEPDGELISYNMKSAGTTSDRFRCMLELADGTLVCGTADGINYLKDGQVTGTITLNDGLQNSQILCMTQENGQLYAGTDGAGIYVITDGKIVDQIDHEDGLSSDVVLRIVPYREGCFLVTSNSLCYMDSQKQITVLDDFPYYNNYDLIVQEDTAYVPCSAGIYKLDADELMKNECGEYELYHARDGLVEGLTANSWNYVCEDGAILLCSNKGVIRFSDQIALSGADVKFGIDHIDTDQGTIYPGEKQKISITDQTKQITLYAAIRNYALTHGKVLFYEEGERDKAKAVDWSELQPLYISTVKPEEIRVHLELLDASGENVLSEQIYTLERKTQMWEKGWYRAYLGFIVIEMISFILWWIVAIAQSSKRKDELEEKVAEQTRAIRAEQEKADHLFMQTVMALSGAVDAKDRYTSGHSKRVAEYSRQIAQRMGKSVEEQNEIYQAGLLHDVGKIRIPEEIINKPGKLTDEEFQLIRIHPVTGYHILKGIDSNHKIAQGSKFHHERYDGKGYPNGLAGEDIPEIARILGVADSYDAMASDRSYRKALPQQVVREEIEKGKGTQFDPAIADIMLAMIDEDTEYRMRQIKGRNKTVLVVDDEPINIKLIIKILELEQSYNVIAAQSGEQALSILDKKRIDLILLDAAMPQMDGYETLRLLRKKYDTPVILMTEECSGEVIENTREYSVDDYVTKPFVPLQLHEIIHSMLN